jgi:hypothetical protein
MAFTDTPHYKIAVWPDGHWCWHDHLPNKRILLGDDYEVLDLPSAIAATDSEVEAFLRYRDVVLQPPTSPICRSTLLDIDLELIEQIGGVVLQPPKLEPTMSDPVNHPPHYTSHPSGVGTIQITEHFNFCIGNAIKYCWRAGLKGDALEDLRKAQWYIEREIQRRERNQTAR